MVSFTKDRNTSIFRKHVWSDWQAELKRVCQPENLGQIKEGRWAVLGKVDWPRLRELSKWRFKSLMLTD